MLQTKQERWRKKGAKDKKTRMRAIEARQCVRGMIWRMATTNRSVDGVTKRQRKSFKFIKGHTK